jgi:MFS family permease
MSEQKKTFHYAFLIFVACCFMGASGMALFSNLRGVFLPVEPELMGISPTEWSLQSIALSLTQVAAFPIWGQLIKKNIRLCVTIGCIIEVVGILSFTVVNSVPGIIFIGICAGIGIPMTFLLTIPVLMNNWFAPKYRGRFLGLAMACSGAGTFVWAPLFTFFMETLGQTNARLLNAVFLAVMVLPFSIFVLRFKPEDMGLKPYGYEKDAESKTETNEDGMKAVDAFKKPVFYVMFIVIGFVACGMGFNSVLVAFARETITGEMAANAAMIGAFMISVAAVGNMLGKVIFGFLQGLIGLKGSMYVFLGLFLLCFLLWILFPGNMIFMYIGAFLLGTHNGITSVGNPMIVRGLFGGMEYQKIYSRLSMASAIVGGFSTTIIVAIAATTGSYTLSMWAGVVLVIVATVLISFAMRYMGKLEWQKAQAAEGPAA